MNPNHLLTFAVVARYKSITQAANFLHLGQPAVSGQLKLLQQEVGEALYERKGHQIVLTSAGLGLLRYAERVQFELGQAVEFVHNLKQVSAGSLRIASTMTMTSYFLPNYLVKLQTEHPGVQVFMETGTTKTILAKIQDYDLGFVEGPLMETDLPANYQLLPWQTDEIVLIMAHDHPLAERYPQKVPLSVFLEYQVIWREPGSGARQVVESALARSGVNAPVTIEVTGVTGVKESVRAGLGIGFASLLTLKNESNGLVFRAFDNPGGMPWQLNIIAPTEENQSRVTRVFVEMCLNR